MKIALGLTLIGAGLYLLTANGHLGGQDQEYYYRMAESLAHNHSFAIAPLVFQNTELAGTRGRDGRFYAEYAPGLPIALSPLVMLGDNMKASAGKFASNYTWLREGDEDVMARILVSYFNIPVTALGTGLLILLVMRIGYSGFAAGLVGASFVASTFAWGQARILNPEPLQTLFLVAAALLVIQGSAKRTFIGGCALGFGVLVKITSVLALPALLLLPADRDIPLWRRPARACAFLVPVVGALAAYAWYDYSRFGSFTATGYNSSGTVAELGGNGIGNPVRGLYGLLFSTGRGLVWYAPPVIAAVAGAARFYRENRRGAVALGVLVALWVALYSSYKGWDSGWGWGPRYLLPVLPFILIPMAGTLHSFAGKLAWVGLFVAGLAIQLPGALVDFMASGHSGMALFARTAQQPSADSFVAWRNFQLSGSEIIRDSALLLRGQVDLAWLTFGNTHLPIITLALVGFLIATGMALLISGGSFHIAKRKSLLGTTP